ncbi:NAD(P)H-hydrate dehydratase [Hyphobacterium sp. HN65]|uniref:Bifunctional NAD(P)H-hydrate repair enzyme n=1 Tax=Hyphobacterium lacteum TaxID=3116575 RepID=A0ABU7LLT4_9PROT|nr:NAD(P)H-hydrate dehydratase [Hyphobacterium sp. HN65]MEE2524848.1 NAD(P)H-hydrate dehydratase [Hyphobacterium sp. HN65]
MKMHPPATKILSVDGHRAADAFAIAQGVAGEQLMEAAGQAVADEIIKRWSPRPAVIFCGPGNNGGDGFVVARRLREHGWPVEVAALDPDHNWSGDAGQMARRWDAPVSLLAPELIAGKGLIVDAIFGAGLSRPVPEGVQKLIISAMERAIPVVAIDLPSGLQGDAGRSAGKKLSRLVGAFAADLTVTFHCLKPAHLLQPGRSLCGEVVLADIGIPEGWEAEAPPLGEINTPDVWAHLPWGFETDIHKHRKGRLCVVSGAPSSTGAARLAALAGLRGGAGLVTLLSPPAAMQVNALHNTAIMVKRFEGPEGLLEALDERRATALVIGPGSGVGDETHDLVIAATAREAALVLDADALTSFESDPAHLFRHLRSDDVLTPHDGEFARLFPDIASGSLNKIERARAAATAAGCTVLLKGADTVIAHPECGVRVNIHASPALATAGSGDVLAGLAGAFLAQGYGGFEAASMAAWLHGDAGIRLGEGLIAEDLPAAIPNAVAELKRRRKTDAARKALTAPANRA